MQKYEHVFIARPDVSPAQMETAIEEIKTLVEEKGGKVNKTEYWGLRTLAYRLNKSRKGHYGYIDMEAGNDVLDVLEYRQRYAEDIMRYMTVKVDELNAEPTAVMRKGDDRKRREGGREGGRDGGRDGGFRGDRDGGRDGGFRGGDGGRDGGFRGDRR